MKTHLLALLLTASTCFGETGQHRGIWMYHAQFKTPQLAEESIAKVAAAHFNVIYPLVWHDGGTAWFKSKFSPMASTVPEGFDPLGYLVKLAHARGIEVHPRFVAGHYGALATKGVFAQHPDWRLQDSRGNEVWYDLGNPAVRNFERDVMLECLKNYDVDGLQFDYIRYNSRVFCYCDHCQNEFAQKYGFRPQRVGDERFPLMLMVSSNPLSGPTTAKVLATFDHGVPAIAVNRLGAGEAVLVNWKAPRYSCPALDKFVTETMKGFGAAAQNTYQLHTTQTAATYGLEEQKKTQVWLKELGFPTTIVDETTLVKTPKGGTVVLSGQYLMNEETTQWLENFVRAGGHCLFVDGPHIKYEPLQRVTGMRTRVNCFTDWRIISPAPDQVVLKSGPPMDVAKELQRPQKWVEYRAWTVTELVRAVYKGAKAIKPRARLSAAVFDTKESADTVCQDWYGWLREGCIDYVVPMAYTKEEGVMAKWFAEWRAFDPRMERIIPGLSFYSPALVRSQLEMCRSNATHGNLFFSVAQLTDDLIRLLSTDAFAKPAKPYYPADAFAKTVKPYYPPRR